MERLQQLQTSMANKNIQSLLITNPVNRRYISEFTGTAGVCLVLQQEAYFITDFRYVEQAKEQVLHMEIVEHKGQIYEEVLKLLHKHEIEEMAFEKESVTYLEYEIIRNILKGVQLQPVRRMVEELRLIKSVEELDVLQEAADIADEAFVHIQSYIKPGVREVDVALELEFFMRRAGATSSSFDIIIASGVRSALPHGVASEKVIEEGELVTLDYGAYYNGYCSDITRTFAVGEISKELQAIYETVEKAQALGIEKIKSGMTGKEADAIPRDFITEAGYGSYFGHGTGHGLGMEVHEGPTLSPRSEEVLKPGMVATVEPGIYIPNVGGCRIEDDIVITETGNRRLTKSPKHLIHLS